MEARNNLAQDIGNRIGQMREARGLSQKQLSEELKKLGLNVRRETITQWENGTRDLKTEYTVKLAEFFGVTCDEILIGTQAKNVGVSRITGLSESSIENLRKLSGRDEENKPLYQDEINSFLGNKNLHLLLHTWGEFQKTATLLGTAKRTLIQEFEANNIDYKSYHNDDTVALLSCAALHLNDGVDTVLTASRVFMKRVDRMNYMKYKLEQGIRAYAESVEVEQGVHGL